MHFSCLPNGRFLRALDNYLSIPLLMLEKAIPAISRRKKYGRLGDFRRKSHGGFEYRTPASWLMSEEIALGVITLSYIIAISYPILNKNFFETAAARKAYYHNEKNYFKPIVRILWDDIKKCPAYQQYSKEIKKIESMILSGQEWRESVDLRRYWRVNIPRQLCKRV